MDKVTTTSTEVLMTLSKPIKQAVSRREPNNATSSLPNKSSWRSLPPFDRCCTRGPVWQSLASSSQPTCEECPSYRRRSTTASLPVRARYKATPHHSHQLSADHQTRRRRQPRTR